MKDEFLKMKERFLRIKNVLLHMKRLVIEMPESVSTYKPFGRLIVELFDCFSKKQVKYLHLIKKIFISLSYTTKKIRLWEKQPIFRPTIRCAS